MLNKKQYVLTILGALLGFGILFGAVFTVTYLKNNKIEEPQRISVEEESVEAVLQEDVIIEEDRIKEDTSVEMRLLEPTGEVAESVKIDPRSLLGTNKEDLAKKFPDYEIEKFTTNQVILTKQKVQKVREEYFLGIKDQWVGIYIVGQAEDFVSLELEAKLFSKKTNYLLAEREIQITKTQKQTLQTNPYYIEQILENYTQ